MNSFYSVVKKTAICFSLLQMSQSELLDHMIFDFLKFQAQEEETLALALACSVSNTWKSLLTTTPM